MGTLSRRQHSKARRAYPQRLPGGCRHCYGSGMHPSERFLGKLRHIKKQGDELEPDSLRAQVWDAFHHSLSGVPPEMAEELFEYFYDRAVPDETPFYVAVERLSLLGDVVDLFYADYDDEADPLAESDWIALRDIVSSYAVTLDMELVNYIMKRVLDHGAI
jgi:hypothetical protein